MGALLRFLSGRRKGQEARLPESGRFVAGRGLRAELVLEDQLASRNHFEIECGPTGCVLRDCGSRNGTCVNGERVSEHKLARGDVIQAGDTTLEFHPTDEETVEERGATIVSRMPAEGLSVIAAGDDIQRAAKDLAIIYRVGNIITSERDMKVLCPLVLDTVLEVLGADSGALLLAEERSVELKEVAARGRVRGSQAYSHRIAGECFSKGVCVATLDALSDERFSSAQSVLSAGIHAALCAPVQTNDAVIGAIYVDRRASSGSFDRRDLELLGAIAKQAGIAIMNARLRAKDIQRERLQREVEIAADVQKNFLPRQAPQIPGYEIAGGSRASMSVGGDYYDFIALNGHVVLVVADVSGHGLAPALLMAELRAALRAKLGTIQQLPEVLKELNRTLAEDMPSGEFVTCFVASLDVQGGSVLYTGAGHDPGIVVRRTGLELLGSTGPPLGILDDAEFPTGGEVRLEPGDVMLLYTDGLWEAGSETGNPLGKKRLFELAQGMARLSAKEMLEGLMGASLEHVGGAPQDDVTAVVLKRL